MKKILFGFAVAIAAVTAQASYLNWQVGAEDGYNGAQLYATTAETATGGTVIDAVSGLPASKSTNLGTTYSDGTYNFYIELVAYDDASSGSYTKSMKMSEMAFTYAELADALSNSALSVAAMKAVWTGSNVQATPEPTSGLMLVLGMALLGLKRRRA